VYRFLLLLDRRGLERTRQEDDCLFNVFSFQFFTLSTSHLGGPHSKQIVRKWEMLYLMDKKQVSFWFQFLHPSSLLFMLSHGRASRCFDSVLIHFTRRRQWLLLLLSFVLVATIKKNASKNNRLNERANENWLTTLSLSLSLCRSLCHSATRSRLLLIHLSLSILLWAIELFTVALDMQPTSRQ